MTQDPPDNQQWTEVNPDPDKLNGVSTPGYTNIRAAGQLIAHYDLSGSQPALYFHFGDWLGTLRVITDAAGNVSPNGQTCIGLPYGNGEYCTPTQSTNYLFAGKERDPETNGPNGNDYFGARYYASTMGQFLTPDWSAKAEPVPYAKVDNPQSLNLYRYVFDNPLTGVDLDGHQDDQAPANDADSFAGDYCATQLEDLAACAGTSYGKSQWDLFADSQKKINQKTSAQPQNPICPGCLQMQSNHPGPLPLPPNCSSDPSCQLQYNQFFGSIHRIPQLQAPSNSILTKLSNLANTVKQHLQHPGCGSALAETGIGAVTTVGIGVAILAAGPEEAAAGFTAAVVSEAEEYGTGGAVLAISDIGHAVGTAAAAPLGVTAQGFSNAVSNCF